MSANRKQIKETFRFHPAVAHGLGRVVGNGGVKIGDRVFEEGVRTPFPDRLSLFLTIKDPPQCEPMGDTS
jgi:hypothetical protein